MTDRNDPRNMFCNRRDDFVNSDRPTPQQPSYENGANKQQPKSDYEQKVEQMKRLAEKYQREGEGQLVKDIVANVIEQKAAGRLTNEQLITFAKRVAPLLNSEQRQRLDGLLQELLKL